MLPAFQASGRRVQVFAQILGLVRGTGVGELDGFVNRVLSPPEVGDALRQDDLHLVPGSRAGGTDLVIEGERILLEEPSLLLDAATDSLWSQTQPPCQSSIARPATRENSPLLFVTRTRSWATAVAAIIRSLGPMGRPSRSS